MARLLKVLILYLLSQFVEGSYTNLALMKEAHMSSSFFKDQTPSPALAVDGDLRTVPPHTIHTAVNQPFAWWTVDIDTKVHNPTVRLYFRTDNAERRYGVQFYTAETNFTEYPQGALCYTVQDTCRNVITTRCPGTWRYLMVYTNQTYVNDVGSLLDFAEVQIIGCERGSYGPYCNSTCFPCSNGLCDYVTGECSEACQKGIKSELPIPALDQILMPYIIGALVGLGVTLPTGLLICLCLRRNGYLQWKRVSDNEHLLPSENFSTISEMTDRTTKSYVRSRKQNMYIDKQGKPQHVGPSSACSPEAEAIYDDCEIEM